MNVEGYGNCNAGSDSLYPFVGVHVEKKRGLDGMELLFGVVICLSFVWAYGMYEKEEDNHSNGVFFYVGKRYVV